MATTEVVYIGRNNEIVLELRENGAAVDLEAITRVIVDLGTFEIDSKTKPGAFDWETDTTKLVMRLGEVEGIENHKGLKTARLIVFANDYPDGLVWTDDLRIEIRE